MPPLVTTVIIPNHPSVTQHTETVHQYLMDELKAGRMSGPFSRQRVENILRDKLRICCHLSKGNKDFPSVNSHIHKEQFPTRFDTAARVADTVSSFSIYISDLDPLRTLYLIVPRLHHVCLWHNHLTIHLWCFHHTSPLVIYFLMIHLWCFRHTSPLVIYFLMIHLWCFHHTSPLVIYFFMIHLWCFYYTSPLVIYLLMIHLGCFHHTSPLVVYYLPSHLWRS